MTRSPQDNIWRYSRRERIPWCIAEDPEENEHHEPGPEINRRNEDAAMRLARNRAPGETEEAINNEWQRHHH